MKMMRCLTVALWLAPALAGAQTMESAADSAREILARLRQARVEKVGLLRICLNPVFFPKNEKAEATFAYEDKTRAFRRLKTEKAHAEFLAAQARAEALGGIRRVKPLWEREPGDDFERTLVGGKDYDLVCRPSPADRL